MNLASPQAQLQRKGLGSTSQMHTLEAPGLQDTACVNFGSFFWLVCERCSCSYSYSLFFVVGGAGGVNNSGVGRLLLVSSALLLVLVLVLVLVFLLLLQLLSFCSRRSML